jgi:hypothetical protein
MPLIPHYRVEIRVIRLNHKKDKGKTVEEASDSLPGYALLHDAINLYEFLKDQARRHQARWDTRKP